MEQKKPRKPRIKKALDIKIDTKHVDVDIKRDASGVVDVIVDVAGNKDLHYHKDAEGKKTFKIIDAHEYDFESNGTSPHLPKGSIWKITGEMLKNFLAKGLGKMIKK
jgi:hypothetical protein